MGNKPIVFIQVLTLAFSPKTALRYYAPVNLGMRTLLFYPPEYPKVDTEVNAVVSHINTPTDFYIQVVVKTLTCILYQQGTDVRDIIQIN